MRLSVVPPRKERAINNIIAIPVMEKIQVFASFLTPSLLRMKNIKSRREKIKPRNPALDCVRKRKVMPVTVRTPRNTLHCLFTMNVQVREIGISAMRYPAKKSGLPRVESIPVLPPIAASKSIPNF